MSLLVGGLVDGVLQASFRPSIPASPSRFFTRPWISRRRMEPSCCPSSALSIGDSSSPDMAGTSSAWTLVPVLVPRATAQSLNTNAFAVTRACCWEQLQWCTGGPRWLWTPWARSLPNGSVSPRCGGLTCGPPPPGGVSSFQTSFFIVLGCSPPFSHSTEVVLSVPVLSVCYGWNVHHRLPFRDKRLGAGWWPWSDQPRP